MLFRIKKSQLTLDLSESGETADPIKFKIQRSVSKRIKTLFLIKINLMRKLIITSFIISLFLVISCNQGSETSDQNNISDSSGESGQQGYAENVYFGDTHLHTELSMDAGAFGNTIGLDEAYQFAKGEAVTSSTGLTAKLSRPLDFLVVADHSDGMGLFLLRTVSTLVILSLGFQSATTENVRRNACQALSSASSLTPS